MAMLPMPANDIGLSFYNGWTDLMAGDPQEAQLQAAGRHYEKIDITHIVGMGGCAYLLCYTSLKGEPVTVLVVPLRGDIDSFAEDYYYFLGMTQEEATKDESAWLARYDECVRLRKRVRCVQGTQIGSLAPIQESE